MTLGGTGLFPKTSRSHSSAEKWRICCKICLFFFRHPSAEGMLVVDLLRYLAYKVTKKRGIELDNIWWKDKQLCEWRWMKI